MESKLKNKLLSYSKVAGGILASSQLANADIIYTNIDPDSTLSVIDSDTLLLDINNDGTDDFRIDGRLYDVTYLSVSSSTRRYAYVYGLNTNSISATGGEGFYFPIAHEKNQVLGSLNSNWNSQFSPTATFKMAQRNRRFSSSTTFNINTNGQWVNTTDKYLGLRFKVGVNVFYGWARLSIDSTVGTVVVKDYAYESTPGKSIITGVVPAGSVSGGIIAEDINDLGNAGDIKVSFNKASDESLIARYDAIIVKESESATFNDSLANIASLSGYSTPIPKTGSNISTILSANTPDKNGAPIQSNIPYKVFILSIADGGNASVNSLSNASNTITLESIPLSGYVLLGSTDDTVKTGTVQLIKRNPDPGQFPVAAQAFIDEDGSYSFPSIIPNTAYNILVLPDIGLYPNSTPTYNGGHVNWQKAPAIIANVGSNGITEDIIVNNVTSVPSGTGKIVGRVVKGEGVGKVQGPGDPLNGLDVSLIDKSTSTPSIGSDQTDQDGYFQFNGLNDGEYGIYVNIPGVPIDTNYGINISGGVADETLVKVTVDSDYIHFEDATGIQIIGFASKPNLHIYPNPSDGITKVDYELKQNASVLLELLSIEGKRISILVDEKQLKGKHYNQLDSKALQLPSGSYLISISIDGYIERKQLITIN